MSLLTAGFSSDRFLFRVWRNQGSGENSFGVAYHLLCCAAGIRSEFMHKKPGLRRVLLSYILNQTVNCKRAACVDTALNGRNPLCRNAPRQSSHPLRSVLTHRQGQI